MSIRVMTWVFYESEEKLGCRLVLLALADCAHDDGSKAFPAVKTIAEKARMSERQVQENLRKLEKSGAIVRTGVTRAGVNIYSVVMGGAESAPAVSGARGAESADQVRETAPEPSEPLTLQSSSSGEAAALPPQFPLARVDSVQVTRSEALLSTAILTAFNQIAGTSFKSPDHLKAIIMRIREYPEVSEEEHVAVMEATLALKGRERWWRGNPGPTLVYGNSRAFDRARARLSVRPEGDTGKEGKYTRV